MQFFFFFPLLLKNLFFNDLPQTGIKSLPGMKPAFKSYVFSNCLSSLVLFTTSTVQASAIIGTVSEKRLDLIFGSFLGKHLISLGTEQTSVGSRTYLRRRKPAAGEQVENNLCHWTVRAEVTTGDRLFPLSRKWTHLSSVSWKPEWFPSRGSCPCAGDSWPGRTTLQSGTSTCRLTVTHCPVFSPGSCRGNTQRKRVQMLKWRGLSVESFMGLWCTVIIPAEGHFLLKKKIKSTLDIVPLQHGPCGDTRTDWTTVRQGSRQAALNGQPDTALIQSEWH